MQETTTKVCRVDELPAGQAKRVDVNGIPIAVYNVEGEFFATEDTCSHAQASLSEGYLEEHRIECPLHGSQFDVRTGEVQSLPATQPVATYRVVVKDDEIYVEA